MSHIYVDMQKFREWLDAMGDWDKGGERAISEMTDLLEERERTAGYANAALTAIYRDAHERGRRSGLQEGVEEKLWLHRSWPLITLGISMLMFVMGIIVGASA